MCVCVCECVCGELREGGAGNPCKVSILESEYEILNRRCWRSTQYGVRESLRVYHTHFTLSLTADEGDIGNVGRAAVQAERPDGAQQCHVADALQGAAEGKHRSEHRRADRGKLRRALPRTQRVGWLHHDGLGGGLGGGHCGLGRRGEDSARRRGQCRRLVPREG